MESSAARAPIFGSIVLAFLLIASPASAQRCVEDVLCVEIEERADSLAFFVVNLRPADVSIRFDVDLQNLAADVAFPAAGAFAAGERTKAFTLHRRDERSGWRYHYQLAWQLGRVGARHDDAYVYALPYAAGAAFAVGQADGGAFSHRGRFAIDWTMPEGTPVHAAREGVVVAVCDSNRVGGIDEALRERANYVLVAHADGTIASYVHLRERGALVRVGDRVQRGQRIGLSGATGYASGPHLHFEVFTLTADLQRQTVPVRFAVDGRAETLRDGRIYRAAR